MLVGLLCGKLGDVEDLLEVKRSRYSGGDWVILVSVAGNPLRGVRTSLVAISLGHQDFAGNLLVGLSRRKSIVLIFVVEHCGARQCFVHGHFLQLR